MNSRGSLILVLAALALTALTVAIRSRSSGPAVLDGLLSDPPSIDYAAQAEKFKKAAARSKAMITQPFKNSPQLSLQQASQDLDTARESVHGDSHSLKTLSKSLSSFAGALRSSAGVAPKHAARQHRLNSLRLQGSPGDGYGEPQFGNYANSRKVHLALPRNSRGGQKLWAPLRPGLFPAFVGHRLKEGPFNYLGNMEMAMQAV